MKTNREKYDHYCGLIAAKDAEAIKSLLPGGVPAQFFTIERFEAKPLSVTGIRRYRHGFYVKAAPGRITKADVDVAQRVAESWAAPTLEEIYVDYTYRQTLGIVSGAYPYPTIDADVNLAWHADSLVLEIERRRALYEPRDGHQACDYCCKQMPESSLIIGAIYYRSIGGTARKVGKYCSQTCHSNDQCGHEG